MKSKYLFLIVLIWGVLLGVCSCSEDDDTGSIFHPTPSDTVTIYPQKIPYTSIEERIRLNSNNEEAHSPIIVNSKEELLQYVHGQSDFYSGIDFSKNSVLLLHGWAGNGVSDVIVRNFQVLSKTEYFLKVLVILTASDVEIHWVTAIITEKIDEDISIQVYVTEAMPR